MKWNLLGFLTSDQVFSQITHPGESFNLFCFLRGKVQLSVVFLEVEFLILHLQFHDIYLTLLGLGLIKINYLSANFINPRPSLILNN